MAAKGTKAPANYAKLADETELTVLGLEVKVNQLKSHLGKMLKDIPERAAIMQTSERLGAWQYQLLGAREQLARYEFLRDRPTELESGE